MIKLPSRTKYKKMHRHILREYKLKKLKIINNSVKIFSIQKGYLTLAQILALRIFIRKSFRKKVKIFMPLLVNYHKTQKGLGMRMGKGKGKGKEWFIGVTYGSILFELISSKRKFIKMLDILRFLQRKISLRTKVRTYEKNLQENYTP
jgi:large subunit ribosomal protein L16